MVINCKNCQEDIMSELSSVPKSWRKQLADTLCKYIICDKQSLDCEQVKDCETLTSLSNFSIQEDGTTICVTYIDEHLVSIERCFNFVDLLDINVDPKCLATPEDWLAMSYLQKWQAIIDKTCATCSDAPTTTTTTTVP